MSDLQAQIDQLTKEKADVEKQLENWKNAHEGVLCQLDAHKGMLQEQLNSSIGLRTQIVSFQRHNLKISDELKNLKQSRESLDKQLSDATAKIQLLEKSSAQV